MRLIILDSYDDVSTWAAKYIRNKVYQFNPGPDRYFTLGLPTGMYEKEYSFKAKQKISVFGVTGLKILGRAGHFASKKKKIMHFERSFKMLHIIYFYTENLKKILGFTSKFR